MQKNYASTENEDYIVISYNDDIIRFNIEKFLSLFLYLKSINLAF